MDILIFFLSWLFWNVKSPSSWILDSHCFLLVFPTESLSFIVKKSIIFLYVSSDYIQHEFFIYFFFAAVIELHKLFCLSHLSCPSSHGTLLLYFFCNYKRHLGRSQQAPNSCLRWSINGNWPNQFSLLRIQLLFKNTFSFFCSSSSLSSFWFSS